MTHPTYISLNVPEPLASRIAMLRQTFDPGYAHLPVEIAIAGSSGVGVISGESTIEQAIDVVDRMAHAHSPITARFTRAGWLSELKVYALEVEAVGPLESLHRAIRSSGLAFSDDVPPDFHSHCALRWTPQWMTREQEQAWNALKALPGDFILQAISIYSLAPGADDARLLHRTKLGE